MFGEIGWQAEGCWGPFDRDLWRSVPFGSVCTTLPIKCDPKSGFWHRSLKLLEVPDPEVTRV